jgi:RNAse (barnase) inhibitor barstar
MSNLLIVDLRNREFRSRDMFWNALKKPCGLPSWLGRNLDTWSDVCCGGMSDVIDNLDVLIVCVDGAGLFARGNEEGDRIVKYFADDSTATDVLFVELVLSHPEPPSRMSALVERAFSRCRDYCVQHLLC